VPVRIALAPKELAAHPLRVGLSMEVEVDIADASGAPLAAATRSVTPYTTAAFSHDTEEAEALVKKTIAANLGAPLKGGGQREAVAKDSHGEAAPQAAGATTRAAAAKHPHAARL
jgi:membrane fusion protein (multidrug efflux system)